MTIEEQVKLYEQLHDEKLGFTVVEEENMVKNMLTTVAHVSALYKGILGLLVGTKAGMSTAGNKLMPPIVKLGDRATGNSGSNEGIVKLKRRSIKTGIPVPSGASDSNSPRRVVKAKDISNVSGAEDAEANEESEDEGDEEVAVAQGSSYKFSALDDVDVDDDNSEGPSIKISKRSKFKVSSYITIPSLMEVESVREPSQPTVVPSASICEGTVVQSDDDNESAESEEILCEYGYCDVNTVKKIVTLTAHIIDAM